MSTAQRFEVTIAHAEILVNAPKLLCLSPNSEAPARSRRVKVVNLL